MLVNSYTLAYLISIHRVSLWAGSPLFGNAVNNVSTFFDIFSMNQII